MDQLKRALDRRQQHTPDNPFALQRSVSQALRGGDLRSLKPFEDWLRFLCSAEWTVSRARTRLLTQFADCWELLLAGAKQHFEQLSWQERRRFLWSIESIDQRRGLEIADETIEMIEQSPTLSHSVDLKAFSRTVITLMVRGAQFAEVVTPCLTRLFQSDDDDLYEAAYRGLLTAASRSQSRYRYSLEVQNASRSLDHVMLSSLADIVERADYTQLWHTLKVVECWYKSPNSVLAAQVILLRRSYLSKADRPRLLADFRPVALRSFVANIASGADHQLARRAKTIQSSLQ